MIVKAVFDEVSLADPSAGNEKTLNDCLIRFVEASKRGIVFIIDE